MTTSIELARRRLIVALDLPERASAIRAVETLSGTVGMFKIGLELFTAAGPALVREIRGRGEQVFLDLKLHDIPNTVARAVQSAASLDVQMLTIHASGGTSMMEAAAKAAESKSNGMRLLGVTALTSLSDDDIARLGVGESAEAWVDRLAKAAYQSGIRGLVCSPREVLRLRAEYGSEVKLVVPGIRPAGHESLDQSRVATPFGAIRLGADYLVVGRPILQSPNPGRAAEGIVTEIRQALEATNDIENSLK